jgi:hypothetical protein
MSRIDPLREAQAAKALRESIAALDGDDALLTDMVEGETQLFEALDRLLRRIADNRAVVEGIAAEEARLGERRRRYEKRVQDDRSLIEQAMMIADLPKLERPTATLSLAKRQPSAIIDTEADIPAEFWKTPAPALDKKALLAALKDGRDVPGATLSNAAPSLTIRIA